MEFEAIESFVLPECRQSRLVFVDGYFQADLSSTSAWPKSCVAMPLDKAAKTYAAVLQARFGQELKSASDPFAILNGAVHGRGLFIYLPPHAELNSPIQVISISSCGKQWGAMRLYLFLGKQASADLLLTSAGQGFAADAIDASLDEGASLRFGSHLPTGEENFISRSLSASLKRSARLQWMSCQTGRCRSFQTLQCSLLGSGAEADLQGLAHLQGKGESCISSLIEHRAADCTSNQHFKAALHDESRSNFEGAIYVDSEAHGTMAYQLSQNLLLGEQASASAKPNLSIFADDVKASHGATFSRHGEEEMFYLRSRGLSNADGEKLLLNGFCREMIGKIGISPLKQEMERLFL